MADFTVGTKVPGSTSDWYTIPAGGGGNLNQVAMIRFTPSVSGFLHTIGMLARRSGANNGKSQLAVWDADPVSGAPTKRLGYTATITIAGLNHYEDTLAWSSRDAELGVVGAAVPVVAGTSYWLGDQNDSAGVEIATNGVSSPTATIYRRAVGSGVLPTDPFGVAAQATPRPGQIYAYVTPSTDPLATITGPAALISTATPTITATIADAEFGAPWRDRIASYVIELREQGETVLLWNPSAFIATSAEKTANAISRVYGGPSLGSGAYELRIQVIDSAGKVGPFTDWYPFTVANQGAVDVSAATPTGKQESGIVTTWSAVWTHPSALAANGARVRILSGTQVLRGGDTAPIITLSPTVADGATISLTDATTVALTHTPNGALPSGSYTWQMQARDTAGGFSPWSVAIPFTVNFAPNQPTGLRPDSGSRSPVRPRIDWLISDPDADDVLGVDLVSEYEITRLSNSNVVTNRTPNVDLATGRGYLDITTTEMPAADDYQWRVRGVDLSAESAGTGLGGWSAPTLFTLTLLPVVTITVPTANQVLQTSSPQIAWTVASGTQSFFRVEVSLPNVTEPFWGSGLIAASNPTSGVYNIPAGVLENGLTYDVRVVTLGPGDVESASLKVRFTVSFPTADTVNNVLATLKRTDVDYEATIVTLSWDVTGYTQLEFGGYIVARREADQPASEAVVIAFIREAGQNTFDDYHAPPNVELIYTLSQLRKVGGDIRQSPITEATITVPLTTPVLASMLSGADLRAPVMMLSDEFAQGFRKRSNLLDVWGTGDKPMLVRSPRGRGSVPLAVGFFLIDDERGTLHQHMARWTAIVESGDPFSLRTETRRYICAIDASEDWLHRTEHLGVMKVELTLSEIFWNESVSVVT